MKKISLALIIGICAIGCGAAPTPPPVKPIDPATMAGHMAAHGAPKSGAPAGTEEKKPEGDKPSGDAPAAEAPK